MSRAEIVYAILAAGAGLYAIFGGADFGAGVWQLIGSRDRDPERRRRIEARIGHSLGPVWEANHVWLIFILVVMWSAFPDAFAAIMQTLYVPLALAALGIVLRGSGFALGHVFAERAGRVARDVFALSSLITPFFMGTVVGAIASGEVVVGRDTGPFEAWLQPMPLTIGFLFVVFGAYIASVFLLDDCRRAGEEDLAEYFRVRAIAAAVLAGLFAACGLAAIRGEARFVFDGLLSEGLPFLLASTLLGGLTLAGLIRGWRRALRPLAIGAVAAVIAGWAVAQYPYLLPETLKVEQAAGADATLLAVIVVFVAALLVVIPALALLYWLAQKQVLE